MRIRWGRKVKNNTETWEAWALSGIQLPVGSHACAADVKLSQKGLWTRETEALSRWPQPGTPARGPWHSSLCFQKGLWVVERRNLQDLRTRPTMGKTKTNQKNPVTTTKKQEETRQVTLQPRKVRGEREPETRRRSLTGTEFGAESRWAPLPLQRTKYRTTERALPGKRTAAAGPCFGLRLWAIFCHTSEVFLLSLDPWAVIL